MIPPNIPKRREFTKFQGWYIKYRWAGTESNRPPHISTHNTLFDNYITLKCINLDQVRSTMSWTMPNYNDTDTDTDTVIYLWLINVSWFWKYKIVKFYGLLRRTCASLWPGACQSINHYFEVEFQLFKSATKALKPSAIQTESYSDVEWWCFHFCTLEFASLSFLQAWVRWRSGVQKIIVCRSPGRPWVSLHQFTFPHDRS